MCDKHQQAVNPGETWIYPYHICPRCEACEVKVLHVDSVSSVVTFSCVNCDTRKSMKMHKWFAHMIKIKEHDAHQTVNPGEVWWNHDVCPYCGEHKVEALHVGSVSLTFSCVNCQDTKGTTMQKWFAYMTKIEQSGRHKCYCDYDTVIRVVGCQCGGW